MNRKKVVCGDCGSHDDCVTDEDHETADMQLRAYTRELAAVRDDVRASKSGNAFYRLERVLGEIDPAWRAGTGR